MVLFNKYIHELLYQYDCVVVPDFGGFICSYSPSTIHPVQHKFHPPAKKISFNKMLVMNDGLLAHHIAIGENITYSESMILIQNEVNAWKEKLTNGQQVVVDGLGKFFQDVSGNLQFQYETSLNFLIDSYGLGAFQAIPIDRSKDLKAVHVSREIEVGEIKTRPVLHKMAKYSAAAAILSVVMLSVYKMNYFDKSKFSEFSLNPFKSEKAVYEAMNYKSAGWKNDKIENQHDVINSDEEVVYLNFEGSNKSLKVRLKDPVEKIDKVLSIKSGRYHVVGGCFGVEKNAEKMLKKLKGQGFNADMNVVHKGLRVVSYQSFEDETQARNYLQKIKSEQNNQAWLLVK